MWFFRRLGGLLRDTFRSLRGHDVALHAAGVTFYAGIAVVPAVLMTIWMSARLVGDERMTELGRSLGDALPDELDAARIAEATVNAGLDLPAVVAFAVLIP